MITLTNKQAMQFVELVKHFPEVAYFTIEENNKNGIGPSTQVRFDLFGCGDNPDTTVNITDTEQW